MSNEFSRFAVEGSGDKIVTGYTKTEVSEPLLHEKPAFWFKIKSGARSALHGGLCKVPFPDCILASTISVVPPSQIASRPAPEGAGAACSVSSCAAKLLTDKGMRPF